MDLIERLRRVSESLRRNRWLSKAEHQAFTEAADELAALRERVEALEGALLPFAEIWDEIDRVAEQHGVTPSEIRRTAPWEACCKARAILAQQGGEVGPSDATKRMERTLGVKFKEPR